MNAHKYIVIRKSPNADSRSANSKPSEDELRESTKSHIEDVSNGLNFIADLIKKRGPVHDHTKMEAMDDFCRALNSGKIKESEWYKNHITQERHHLKSCVPNDVTLIDVIEHLVDCTMAGLARSGDVYDVDLSADLLEFAVQNTVEFIKDNTEVLSDTDDILKEEL